MRITLSISPGTNTSDVEKLIKMAMKNTDHRVELKLFRSSDDGEKLAFRTAAKYAVNMVSNTNDINKAIAEATQKYFTFEVVTHYVADIARHLNIVPSDKNAYIAAFLTDQVMSWIFDEVLREYYLVAPPTPDYFESSPFTESDKYAELFSDDSNDSNSEYLN